MLPDHTAYAVSRGLDDWCGWAPGPRTAAEWQSAKTEMRIQGYNWRLLLTGEKATPPAPCTSPEPAATQCSRINPSRTYAVLH